MNDIVGKNSFQAWVLAARPKTLAGAGVPVMIALALAAKDMGYAISWIPALLCVIFAFLMQIDANFVNDYFDWRRGNDDPETRLGPLRACSQGWVTPKAMVIAVIVTTLIACLVGLPLIFYGGEGMVLVGVACVVFCVLYTTTLSYIAMGDVLVLLFFGVVPVCFTYYLQIGNITLSSFLLSVACGICVDTLLVINNYRDIDNDLRDGKRTLIVIVGKEWGRRIYLLLGVVASVIVMFVVDFKMEGVVLMAAYLFIHSRTYIRMLRVEGRALNRILGLTARNIFVFGLLTSLVVLL